MNESSSSIDPAGIPGAGGTAGPPSQEILLVDDEASFRFLLVEFLRRSGYVVHEAENGRVALQFLQEHPVGLIVSDVCMPDFDGIELMRALRNHPRRPALVVMSGGMTGGTLGGDPTLFLKIAQSLGAIRTLPKPFPLEVLLKVVQEAIGFPR